MSAFNPISPAAAIALLEGAGVPAITILADFAAAGLVKTYASHLLMHDTTGVHETRGGRLDREIWDRIIEAGKVDEVFSVGSVRLSAMVEPFPLPKVTATGIRFDEKSVRAAAEHHGITVERISASLPPPRAEKPSPTPASNPVPVVANAIEESAKPKRPPKVKKDIPEGALQLDVDDAAAVLGVGRTSIYKLIGQGVLVRTKTLNCTRVTVESIRAHIAAQA